MANQDRVFVVKVKDRNRESEGFFAIDRQSGGYPWISDNISLAEKFYSLDKIPFKEFGLYDSYQICELKCVPLDKKEFEHVRAVSERIKELETELFNLKRALQ